MRFGCSRVARVMLAWCLGTLASQTWAADGRLRSVAYSSDEVYRLRGYAGYQIDLEFEASERFIGLGSGDVEGLAYESQGNHLFIKPKAINVRTNLTVLTNRRTYHFEYVVGAPHAHDKQDEIMYALQFQYSKPPASDASPADAEFEISKQNVARVQNTDYWFCGRAEVQPLQAWDDGLHTHLRFSPRMELPALFVRNDDGSESLLNFSIDRDEIVVHRIARQFMVRRGKLVGCIVNRGFSGSADAPRTGTVSPRIERTTRTSAPAP